jgi:photoactive yellow protein
VNVVEAVPSNLDADCLFDWLEGASPADLELLTFGVVAMAPDGKVEHYNLAEAKISGLTPERVVGRHFFTAVAPCTNNFMVAHRFESSRRSIRQSTCFHISARTDQGSAVPDEAARRTPLVSLDRTA